MVGTIAPPIYDRASNYPADFTYALFSQLASRDVGGGGVAWRSAPPDRPVCTQFPYISYAFIYSKYTPNHAKKHPRQYPKYTTALGYAQSEVLVQDTQKHSVVPSI